MAYPRIAGHDFDRASLLAWTSTYSGNRMWDLGSVADGGAGNPAIAQHSSGRLALRARVAGQSQAAAVRVKLWELRPPQPANGTRTEFLAEHGGQYHEFEIEPQVANPTPRVAVWVAYGPGSVELGRITIAVGKLRTLVDGNQLEEPGTSISNNVRKVVTVFWKSAESGVPNSGDMRVWIDGTEIPEIRQQHSVSTAYTEFRLGAAQVDVGSSNSDIWFFWHELAYEGAMEEFGWSPGSLRFRDRGLGQLRAVGDTWAKVFVDWHPGVHKAAWFAANDLRVRFYGVKNGTWSPGDAAALTGPLEHGSATDWQSMHTITGLDPTAEFYTVKVRVFRNGREGIEYYESPHTLTIRPKNLTIPRPHRIGFGHCQGQGQYLKHFHVWNIRDVDEIWFIGDNIYNDASTAGVEPAGDETPCANTADLRRAYRRGPIYDRFFAEACRTKPFIPVLDDHDYAENDYTAAYRRGVPTQFNPLGLNGTAYEANSLCTDPILNAAGVRVRQLIDQNRPAAKHVWFDGLPPGLIGGSGDFNREPACTLGLCRDVLLAVLNTREYQDKVGNQPTSNGQPTMLGADQLAAWRQVFQTTTKPIIIILSGGAWCDLAGGGDNWKDFSPAERILLEQDLQNNPHVHAVFILCGDRHYTLVDRRREDGQNSRSGFSFSKMACTAQIGPALRAIMPAFQEAWNNEPGVLLAEDQGIPAGRYASMIGILNINPVLGTASVEVISAEDNTDIATFALDESLQAACATPNRVIGAATTICAQEEELWSEPVTDGTGQALGVEFFSESLRRENQMAGEGIRPGSGRSQTEPRLGRNRVVGVIRGELQPNGFWPLMLKHALNGDVEQIGSGPPYQHRIVGSEGADPLPAGLTLQKRLYFSQTGTFRYFWYTGCRIERLRLLASQNMPIGMEAEFIGRREIDSALTLCASPNYPAESVPFNTRNASIRADFGSGQVVSCPFITSLDLSIENALVVDYGPGSAGDAQTIRVGGRRVRGSIRAQMVDDALEAHRLFANDGSMAGLEVSFVQGSHSIVIQIPSAKVTGSPTPKVQGRGPTHLDFGVDAYKDADSGTDIIVTIVNDDPVLSTF